MIPHTLFVAGRRVPAPAHGLSGDVAGEQVVGEREGVGSGEFEHSFTPDIPQRDAFEERLVLDAAVTTVARGQPHPVVRPSHDGALGDREVEVGRLANIGRVPVKPGLLIGGHHRTLG